MKRNLYDIFDHWNDELQELPSLKEQPVNSKSLTDRVMQKADIQPVQKKRISYRMFGIIGAAAVLAGGTLTAGALSGRMDQFFSAVSGAEIRDAAATELLPGVDAEQPDDTSAQLESFYSCPDVTFTQTDAASIEFLGLYNDHNTLMMSFQLTVDDGTVLTENMYMLPYFTLTLEDGTKKTLSQSGGLTQPLQKSEAADNIYYLTYYLTDPELTGGTLHADFAGVYKQAQEQTVQEKMIALDDELRVQYYTEGMTTGEWKKFQHENDFDELRANARREAWDEETPVLSGTWSGDIPVTAPESEPLTIETDRNICVLDDLSVWVSDDFDEDHYSDEFDLSDEESCGVAVFLKDGTVLASDFRMFDDVETDASGLCILDGTRYYEFAYMQGTHSAGSDVCDGSVYCFSRPVSIDEIEKVVEYTSYFDDSYTEHFNEYVIYQAQ